MVGTPGSPVIRCRSSAWTTRPGNAIPASSASVAPTRTQDRSCESPYPKESCITQSTRSASVISRYSTIDPVTKQRLRWVSVTPFGPPVDPDVYMTAARSVSSGNGGGGPSLAASSSTSRDDRDPPGARRRGAGEVGALRVADDRRGLGVCEHVVEALVLDRRVEGREGGAGPPRSLDRDRRRDVVGEQERDPVATPHAELSQAGREAGGQPIQLAVGDLAVAGYHRRPGRGRVAAVEAQVLGDRADAHAAARFRSTKPVMASIEPKFSSVISTSSMAIA